MSIGHHQDAKTEVDLEYCREAGVPVYQREIGGGAVYLDEGQTFWHTIFHQSRVPSEKFRDKMYSTMKEYLTTINRQLGDDAPTREEGVRIVVECFSETLGTELVLDEPRPDELAAIAEQEEWIASQEWLHLDGLPASGDMVKIAEGVRVVEGVRKAPGGLVRATVAVRDGAIDGIVLSGDFFMEPAEALEDLQDALVGVRHNHDDVLGVIKAKLGAVDAPGLDATDVASAVMAEPQDVR